MLIVETGIGQANVARALDWLLAKPRIGNVAYVPRSLVFAGYAGALIDSLRVGDIVYAEEIVDRHGGRWPSTFGAEGPWQRGRVLTIEHLSATPAEKRVLAAEHQAIAVEMESAIFAARCTAARLPFACVRAISDEVSTTLSPSLTTLLAGGTVSPWRALKAVVRHPSLVPEFWRLARDTKRASEQLGIALGKLLTLPVPGEL